MVEGVWTASLKVAVTVVVADTFVAFGAGVSPVTVGGVVRRAVVKTTSTQ